MKRALISLVVGASIAFSSVSFAGTTETGPLAPGKAAGVKKAESFITSHAIVLVGGLGVVIGGAFLLGSGGGGHSVGTVCTGTISSSGGCVIPTPSTSGTSSTSSTH